MSKIFFDENSEKQLLACMIMDNKVICDVIAKTQASMFHEAKHRVIYENIIKLYKSGINVDLCTLTTELMNNGLLPAAGNAGYVASLTDEVPTASNFNFYQDKIIKYAQCRALYLVLKDNLEKLGQADNSTIFKNLEDNVFKISSATTATKIWTPKALAEDYNEFLKYSEETWGEDRGIKVGFPTLDRMTDGFQNEDVIIIGARPSIGKTALAISMMQNLMEKDISCGFISAEMSQRQIMTRMVSQRTRLDAFRIRSGKYTSEMKQKLYEATAYYASRKFYIDDTPNIELDALISSARHMKLHYGIRILFVDYMGLITVDKDGPVWEKVSDISKALKALARELKIPVVSLCQLGRDAEGNEPTISNIRGSGSVEQDADLVILLNGERDLTCYRNPNPFLERDMTLAKHRNGPCGKVYLNFEKQFTIFSEDPDQEGRAEDDKMKNMTDKEREKYLANKNKHQEAY
ncbi:MAG: hypothetical protein MSA36_08595 [Treponema porcinum]|uniref:replicative DNA helicase n=1 Tax=Treponema porcinum TaxID=261392 RepID=UPI002355B83C|nr:DnaB-like helicase C-terminal domain-containing protein [Treponema porcinum]MCI7115216.1 hypothetical protein [Treponema porcinum]MCI7535033.1 hypothetical protein [Treponema porcinum]